MKEQFRGKQIQNGHQEQVDMSPEQRSPGTHGMVYEELNRLQQSWREARVPEEEIRAESERFLRQKGIESTPHRPEPYNPLKHITLCGLKPTRTIGQTLQTAVEYYPDYVFQKISQGIETAHERGKTRVGNFGAFRRTVEVLQTEISRRRF